MLHTRTIMAARGIGFILCFLAGAALSAERESNSARIQPWPENPAYWQYQGKPILLLGGSDEDNLFNNPALLEDNLVKMRACGANYIRSTLSIRDEGNVAPYKMRGDKYDLDTFNPEFWNRLERSIRLMEKQDGIVQIEFWATFDHYREFWINHPFNPAKNWDVTQENSRLLPKWDFHPAERPQPFFFSVPGLNDDKVVLKYQEAYVRKVLDVTLPYPNVLYCLDNETRAPAEWAWYWGRFIQEEGKKRNTSIQVTEMWDDWDLRKEEHSRTYLHPDIFSFVDVSQNNWQIGQTHYDRLIEYRARLKSLPGGLRPMNNVKVYQRQGGRLPNDPAINIDRWWQNLFAGCASTRFHRPTGGIGLDEAAQQVIRAARHFTANFDVFHSEPLPKALSDREENEAYCLAVADRAYALYFPQGGEVVLALPREARLYTLRWFDPRRDEFLESQVSDSTESSWRLKSPATGSTWLALVERRVR